MKICSWNCNGALRNKIDAVHSLSADILIIQECEDPNNSTQSYKDWASNYNFIWEGENKNKGIGIFAKPQFNITRLEWDKSFSLNPKNSKSSWHTKELKQFIPFMVNNEFLCLAVWTKGSQNEVFGYMGQFWKYLQIHRNDFVNNKTIIAGDFNSNSIWDKHDRWWSHTDVVNELEEIQIESLYHKQHRELQGSETQPTFYHQRNKMKPYHIDYVFASNHFTKNFVISIGLAEDWLNYSDHMPICLSIKNFEK